MNAEEDLRAELHRLVEALPKIDLLIMAGAVRPEYGKKVFEDVVVSANSVINFYQLAIEEASPVEKEVYRAEREPVFRAMIPKLARLRDLIDLAVRVTSEMPEKG